MEKSSKMKFISTDRYYRCFAIVICILLGFVTGSWAVDKPNLIFILADDLGYGDVGYNGQQHILTPRIDQMAAEGKVLTDHYAGATVCMPSRGALMTGFHTGHGRIRGNPNWTVSGVAVDLKPGDITVAEEMKRAGYKTAVIGKWGLAENSLDGLPTWQGFDYFMGYRTHVDAHHHYWPLLWENERTFHIDGNDYMNTEGKYVHDIVTDSALQYIRDKQEDPFFLFVAYALPHYELTVPEDSKEPYKNLGWPKEPRKKAHYRDDEDGNVAYAGMVSRMDRDVGRILDLLRQLDLEENTLVIFTSDNGPVYERDDRFFNSNGVLRGGKRDLYEGGIRVPFVAWWPGKIEPGSNSAYPSAFWDFLPTACELAGIEPTEKSLNGISYLPTLMGQKQKNRDAVLYWEFNEVDGPIQAIRKGNWKAVKYLEKPIELYNLASDISETTDLATRQPDQAARMLELLDNTRTHSDEFPLTKRKSWGFGSRKRPIGSE
mgnify:CR=1 FL=1|tara:strand:+ start:1236 stop:2702 length:1467 start_codon:yes stop_codon:yes gene_type:complete